MSNTKFYLAARYSRHPEMRVYRNALEEYNIDVLARWIEGDHQALTINDARHNFEFNNRCAHEDIEDLEKCDVLVTFTESPREFSQRPTGGRHVELGLALAWNKEIHTIGPRENVFYYCNNVHQWNSWHQFMSKYIDENYTYQVADLMEQA